MGSMIGLILCVLSRQAAGEPAPVAPSKPLVVRDARIFTLAGPPLDPGTIVVEGERIASVSRDAPVPAEATLIEGRGLVVIPGLIDAGSSLLVPWAEHAASGSAEFDVADAVDPFGDDLAQALAGGTTTALLVPPGRGSFAGRCALLHLTPASDPRSLSLKRGVALKMSLGVSGGDSSSLAQRVADYKGLRQAFENARQYREGWEKYRKELADWEEKEKGRTAGKKEVDPQTPPPKSGKHESEKPDGKGAKPQEPKKPRRPSVDARQETILAALDGALPVFLEAHFADSIRQALVLTSDFKLKLVLVGASEASAVADELAKAKVPVVVGPLFRYGIPKVDYLRHSRSTAAVLASKGVPVVIASLAAPAAGHAGPGAHRFLLESAGIACSGGLSREQALKAVTIEPARLLGLDATLGTLEVGKRADFVVLTADPFEAGCRVRCTVVAGAIVHSAEPRRP